MLLNERSIVRYRGNQHDSDSRKIGMNKFYFDDEQAIGPQDLTLLHKVLVALLSEVPATTAAVDELEVAKELIALFKSGFRTEEELKVMASRMPILERQI